MSVTIAAADSVNRVVAIDLFCGAGGLSHGLQEAGVTVVAGVDNDPGCRYPFESNIDASFLLEDVRNLTASHLVSLWSEAPVRLLAGCAPCQPFSPYRRGADTSNEEQWALVSEFGRLINETKPELVTMENVPRIGSTTIFASFIETLRDLGYYVDWRSCYAPDYGVPQQRRRLVLLASLFGHLKVPHGELRGKRHLTVRDVIGGLPRLAAGGADPQDDLHKSREVSELNRRRLQESRPGGTWEDWPEELRAPCHRRNSGRSFRNVYARMEWDLPAPTITTLAHNFGTGRFGHPEQDRSLSLREAAMLQGFHRNYRFTPPSKPISFAHIGRLIGNAVPPPLAKAVGAAIVTHVSAQYVVSTGDGLDGK